MSQQYGQQQYYPPPPGQGVAQGQPQYGQAPQQPYQQQQSPQPPPSGYGQYVSPPAQGQPQQYAPQVPAGKPQSQQLAPSTGGVHADSGAFQGGTYDVTHRDTNAVLNIELQQGAIKAKPGVMIHMASTVHLSGEVKFSMKKLLTGGQLAESVFQGNGKVALAPTMFGDIITLHLDGRTRWKMGREGFLACTQGVTRETKSQGFAKTMFSGESLFVYHVNGQGTMWLTSFGAVDRLDLQPGEQHIVDNGHLVAWSCDYSIEKAGGGGMQAMKTGEGLVCRFTGPGSIYIQTRNQEEFESYIKAVAGPRQ